MYWKISRTAAGWFVVVVAVLIHYIFLWNVAAGRRAWKSVPADDTGMRNSVVPLLCTHTLTTTGADSRYLNGTHCISCVFTVQSVVRGCLYDRVVVRRMPLEVATAYQR